MTVIEQQRILEQTHGAKADAQRLLDELIQARERSASRLAETKAEDAYERVTGRSSLDVAIERTRHMIDALERAVTDAESKVTSCATAAWSDPRA